MFSQTPVEATLIEASTLVVVGTGCGGPMETWACGTDLWAVEWLGANRCLWFVHRLAAVGLTLRSLAPIPALAWAVGDSSADDTTTTVDSATMDSAAEETASVDATEASRKESVGSSSTSPSVYTGGDGHQEAAHNHGFDALQEEITKLLTEIYIEIIARVLSTLLISDFIYDEINCGAI